MPLFSCQVKRLLAKCPSSVRMEADMVADSDSDKTMMAKMIRGMKTYREACLRPAFNLLALWIARCSATQSDDTALSSLWAPVQLRMGLRVRQLGAW